MTSTRWLLCLAAVGCSALQVARQQKHQQQQRELTRRGSFFADNNFGDEPSTGFSALRLRVVIDEARRIGDGRRAPFISRRRRNDRKEESSERAELRASLDEVASAVLRHLALRRSRSEGEVLQKRMSALYEATAASETEGADDVLVFLTDLAELLETKKLVKKEKLTTSVYAKPYAEALWRLSVELEVAESEVDFCLSLTDRTFKKTATGEAASATRELNALSNTLLRAATYGLAADVVATQKALLARRSGFSRRWCGSKPEAPELAYLEALTRLAQSDDELSEERAAVNSASFATFFRDGVDVEGDSSKDEKPLSTRLGDAYAVALQRFLGELTRRGAIAGVATSDGVAPAFAEKASLFQQQQQQQQQQPLPTSNGGSQTFAGFNFIEWEMRLRRELADRRGTDTKQTCSLQPKDFVGTWRLRLVDDDVAPSQPLALSVAPEDDSEAFELRFEQDGTLNGKFNGKTTKALSWRVRPGPAHLDTCEFEVDLQGIGRVAFCGYVDRGQRIESRFSRRPIRVSGFAFDRVTSAGTSGRSKDLEPLTSAESSAATRPSSRFAMSGPVDTRSSIPF